MGHKNTRLLLHYTESTHTLNSEQRPHQNFAINSHLNEFESESSVFPYLQVLVLMKILFDFNLLTCYLPSILSSSECLATNLFIFIQHQTYVVFDVTKSI